MDDEGISSILLADGFQEKLNLGSVLIEKRFSCHSLGHDGRSAYDGLHRRLRRQKRPRVVASWSQGDGKGDQRREYITPRRGCGF